jgi:hypothetical protein
MNNLTKIAALPTGGGSQSALRPEDRGAERAPFATDGFVPKSIVLHTAFGMIGDQVEAVSIEPGKGPCLGVFPMLTLNYGGPPPEIAAELFRRDWEARDSKLDALAALRVWQDDRQVWPEKCRAEIKVDCRVNMAPSSTQLANLARLGTLKGGAA